mmetsp:Transcript_31725/g.58248  ORF Transcript_31725/g.58248 Transcript_31725/m.58248 type:complete len:211 (-) Transcript_31725:105-737(-)
MPLYYDDPYYGGIGGYGGYGGYSPVTTYRSSPRYYDSYDYGYSSYGGLYDDYYSPRAVPVTAQVYERAPSYQSHRRPATTYYREYDYLPPATTYIERPAPVTTYVAPPVTSYAAPPVTTSYVQQAYMPQATSYVPPVATAYVQPQQSMYMPQQTTFMPTAMPPAYPQEPYPPQYPSYNQKPHTHKETRPVTHPAISPQPSRTKKKKGSCP